ncbi:hypothetical protein Tco_0344100 [Tanacetum coccineum]
MEMVSYVDVLDRACWTLLQLKAMNFVIHSKGILLIRKRSLLAEISSSKGFVHSAQTLQCIPPSVVEMGRASLLVCMTS